MYRPFNSRLLGQGRRQTAWLCSLALSSSAVSATAFAQLPQAPTSQFPASQFSASQLPGAQVPGAQVPGALPIALDRPVLATTPRNADSISDIEVALEPIKPAVSPPVVTALAATRDDRYLAVAGDDHVIRLLDARTGRLLGTFKGHTDWVQSLAFDAEGTQLYSVGNDGRLLRWDYRQPDRPLELIAVPYALRSVSISTERGLLAIGGFGQEVGLWDLKAGKWLFKFSCSCGDQRCVRFSPAGDKLLCGGRDGMLNVWDTTSGEELAQVALHKDRIQTAIFNVDGTTVTSVGDDRRVIRFDLSRQEVLLNRELKGAKLRSLCLINDSLIAAAGADNTIHLMFVDDDEEAGALTGHTGSVAVMCNSGDRLVSGSFDTTVRVWDYKSAIRSKLGTTSVPVSRGPLDVDKRIEIR